MAKCQDLKISSNVFQSDPPKERKTFPLKNKRRKRCRDDSIATTYNTVLCCYNNNVVLEDDAKKLNLPEQALEVPGG